MVPVPEVNVVTFLLPAVVVEDANVPPAVIVQ
jgi:hypothetical protein